MTAIKIDASQIVAIRMTIRSGEVLITGQPQATEIAVSYGYFADNNEVLQEESMRPELQPGGSAQIVLRQTPAQLIRASSVGAHIRTGITVPPQIALEESRLENGTLFIQDIGEVNVSLNSGTVHLVGLAAGFRHRITVGAGTIILLAGELLPIVSAEVRQGVIEGEHTGVLQRLGQTGWKLSPNHKDPDTSIECCVDAGTIMIRSR